MQTTTVTQGRVYHIFSELIFKQIDFLNISIASFVVGVLHIDIDVIHARQAKSLQNSEHIIFKFSEGFIVVEQICRLFHLVN